MAIHVQDDKDIILDSFQFLCLTMVTVCYRGVNFTHFLWGFLNWHRELEAAWKVIEKTF